MLHFARVFGCTSNVQVIMKLENIHLTHEKQVYEGLGDLGMLKVNSRVIWPPPGRCLLQYYRMNISGPQQYITMITKTSHRARSHFGNQPTCCRMSRLNSCLWMQGPNSCCAIRWCCQNQRGSYPHLAVHHAAAFQIMGSDEARPKNTSHICYRN